MGQASHRSAGSPRVLHIADKSSLGLLGLKTENFGIFIRETKERTKGRMVGYWASLK